jgi:hypothetical protein
MEYLGFVARQVAVVHALLDIGAIRTQSRKNAGSKARAQFISAVVLESAIRRELRANHRAHCGSASFSSPGPN